MDTNKNIVTRNDAPVKYERVPVNKDGRVVFIIRRVHVTSDGRKTRMYK